MSSDAGQPVVSTSRSREEDQRPASAILQTKHPYLHCAPWSFAMSNSLHELSQQLIRFAHDRDWQQFHSPKNLASALIVEAGELLEHFQWTTEEQSRSLSPEKQAAVAGELADVLLYLVQLANALGIDPVAAAQAKLQANELRYPADKARGNSKKYTEL